jgi:Tfp pilus assembly protein PilF
MLPISVFALTLKENRMFRSNLRSNALLALLICCVSLTYLPSASYAQGEEIAELKQKAEELIKNHQYTEALPLLEKVVAADPNDPQTHFYLGFALIAQANITKDDVKRKELRIRARAAYIKAKELGIKEPVVDALITSTPADGSDGKAFSENPEANRLMTEAEGLFSQGNLGGALENYQKALELDPHIYEAALFSGDVHTQRGDLKQAEVWYQKAIAINPDRETAYRYSATPLMKQKKYDEARDRYVEAYVAEPYNRYSAAGLTQWAQVTGTRLAHADIKIPTDVTFDEKGNAKINLDASTLLGGKDDGAFAWISYGATRSIWRKEKFAKRFPEEKTYRHSLAEEAEALRSVIAIATGDKKAKTLNSSIAKLKKLNDEGLLEAFILLAQADAGVAEDYAAYRHRDRDKLRRYVVQYVLTGGGK